MPQTTPKTRSSQRLAAGMAQTTNPSLGNNPSACTPFSHALSPSPLPFPYPSTPTQAQIEAVEELKQYSDTDIVRWLAPLRAIEPDFHFRPNKWGFSRQRVDAVAILCDQDDETVLRWLKDARSQSAGSSPSSVADAGQKRRAHGAKSPKPNLKVQHPNQDHDHLHNPTSPCEVHHITRTLRHKGKDVGVSIATDKEKQIKGPPQKAPSKHPSPMINDNASNRIYFCTKCYRPYKNSDDCKKHEKEYEDIYVCRALEQDDAVCVAADQTPTMFKRRYDMVAHLRTHNIHQDGAAIADQWKVCSSKNAYACGFCIHYFPTLKDRLRHIHDEHFKRRRQTMRDWDNDKVILGLLDQPGVKDCWEFKKSTMPFLLARFHWGKAAVEKLLGLLEEGPNGVVSAMTLAQAAYDDLEWEFGDDGINPPTYQTDGQEHATPVAQLEPPSPSNVKLEDPDPIRSSRMTKQASHASHSSKWPSIPDPWNYMPDGLSNGYMSPQPAFASPFLSSKQATPYTDGRSTHYSGPSFRTPRTGSTINPNSAMMRYQLPQNEENVKRSVEQPQDIDFGEGTMEYYTMGAIGESPTMPHERLHEPPSPSKSPSVTQRIKKACRKKSKSGICGGKG